MTGRPISRRTVLCGLGALAATAAVDIGLPRRAGSARARSGPTFGVQTPPQETTYADIERVWKEAETLGYDVAYVFDHFMPIFGDPTGPCLEGWTLLSALAAATRRLRLGVLVTGNTYRHPALLAKMAVTVDQVSSGRLVLGLGAGWFEQEHLAYGMSFGTAASRARQLVEAVEVLKLLFTRERSTYKGRYYALRDAPFEPKPVQRPHPPLLIGGMGPQVIQPLAARHADIWHFFVRDGGPETARRICDNFDTVCRRVGRDPAAVTKATSVRPAGWNESISRETREQVRVLTDAGVGHVVLSLRAPYDLDVLRGFAREIIPAFRDARG
jgi:F420-dependent oxidoreductase-like protein